ncbi:hypothetical protein DLM45_04705 [Hyphomicrobium methylovorum]|uniref:TIGR02186 family protein n=1 Tax=Hyphomicrobium methylovorum TaxID=84 RepID=UPI0015E675F2|nr:TIGR02186 family protein [Hyphomicrobium methylovorum]MBA2125525.1 hypothetical protein [Hyphomicrobium methylovorum]
MRRWSFAIVSLMLLTPGGSLGQAAAGAPEGIESDASTRQVAITSSFTGTEILVFGTVENSVQESPEAGTYDIAVVVEGMPQPAIVRRKARVGGIWINVSSVRFANLPSFYAIASTRPIDEFASAELLDAEGIGFDHIPMKVTRVASAGDVKSYKEAFIRLKTEEGLYVKSNFGVSFIGRSLFRSTIALPPNVPVAPLTARVFLFKDGKLLGRSKSTVMLEREGLERYLHSTAFSQPLLYGLATVLMAVAGGLAAAFAFRRTA